MRTRKMPVMEKFILTWLLLLFPAIAMAGSTTDVTQNLHGHAQINVLVTKFVEQQTAHIPGKVNIQIEPLDPRLKLSQCTQISPFLPNGSQLIGKTSIGVRCADKNGWSIFVPVQIKITQALLISARQLTYGHVLQEQDISSQSIEMSRPSGFTEPSQVLGKVLRYSIAAGQVLRDDMLRPPYSVTQGQIIQVISRGTGFSVRNEGVALNNASEGQNVQVRVASGRVIGGTAQNGTVEIAP